MEAHIDAVTRRKPPSRYGKAVLVLLLLLGLFNAEHAFNFYEVATYDGDPQLSSLADDAGLNLRGKALFLSHSPELVTANEIHQHCPREDGALGCYVPQDNKIYILHISSEPYSNSIPSTIAHEMLHAAWADLSIEDRDTVSSALDNHLSLANDNYTVSVKEKLAGYPTDRDTQIGEAYAFIGSEVFESETDDVLDEHFRRYFAERDNSAQANASYESEVDKIAAGLNERSKALEVRASELDEYEARWLRSFDYTLQQALYYGDYYSYNNNVDRYNSNLSNYNSMVDAYERDRLQLISEIDAYNAAMDAMRPDEKVLNTTSPIQ